MKYLLAINVPRDENAGAASTVLGLGKKLQEKGHYVDFVFNDDLPFRTKNPAWHRLYFSIYLIVKLVGQRIKKVEYDVLIVSGGYGYLIPFSRFLFGKPLFINRSHGPEYVGEPIPLKQLISYRLPYELLIRWQCEIATKYADLTLVTNQFEKTHMTRNFNLDINRIIALPPAIHDMFFDKHLNYKNKCKLPKLLYVGTWIERKGVNQIVKAYNMLCGQYDGLSLTIVGIDNKDEVESEFENSMNVYAKSAIDRKDLIKIYDSHQVLIFPTLSEGYGKVVLEAMSRGMCVITTPMGYGAEIINHNENGFIVPFHDHEAIVSTISTIISDQKLLDSISVNARKSVEGLTWDNVADKTIEISERYK